MHPIAAIADLEAVAPLGGELVRRAAQAGVQLIWRAQVGASRRVVVRNGKPEGTSVGSIGGHGLQVVTPEGHTALGSRDDFDSSAAVELFDRTLKSAGAGGALGLAAGKLTDLTPERGREIPDSLVSPAELDLGEAIVRLAEIEREVAGAVPGVSLAMSYRSELEAWRIMRDDGTDVLFAMPRGSLGMQATTAGDGDRHGVIATVFSSSPHDLFDDAFVAVFVKRAVRAAELARTLPDAPVFPAGSYALCIDYALAKGLAHEAFGHAAEADGFRSSILAGGDNDGRFRVGQSVGPEHVSIIDEPVRDDHAYQPFSANGVRRGRSTIVDHGKLVDGLSDPWSAKAGGVRMTGSARAESFRSAPQPRMTNIRIELDEPLPAPGEFEDYGPDEVRTLLADAGVLRRHPRVVYLSGYSGGQVNTTTGDFVFNCKAIYELNHEGRDAVRFYKPAIFSGSMFGALQAVREGFGPLKLDATGYCGKWGQRVPSSGGSHYFLMLEPDPTVHIGGR